MSACPANCGRSVKAGMLLCAPCWHSVPVPLQIAVWRTWRTWGESLVGNVEYRKAADAAIAAAKELVTQKVLPV